MLQLQYQEKQGLFLSFPKKNDHQRDLWVKAVNRSNPDGSRWLPRAVQRPDGDRPEADGEVRQGAGQKAQRPSLYRRPRSV